MKPAIKLGNRIGGSKIVGSVPLGDRLIYITRDDKLHVSDGTGPMPTEAEVTRAVADETAARRAATNEMRAAAVLMRIGKMVK